MMYKENKMKEKAMIAACCGTIDQRIHHFTTCTTYHLSFDKGFTTFCIQNVTKITNIQDNEYYQSVCIYYPDS